MGAAVARKLASRGISVLMADIQVQERGEELARELAGTYGTKAMYLQTDISNEEDVKRMVAAVADTWCKLDYAANCAGICERVWAEEESITTELVNRYAWCLLTGT